MLTLDSLLERFYIVSLIVGFAGISILTHFVDECDFCSLLVPRYSAALGDEMISYPIA